jgi:ferredoxin
VRVVPVETSIYPRDTLAIGVPSPYDVLGVDEDADDADIVDAYRSRVKETHPDHGGSARQFRAVQNAYERLLAGDDAERDSESGGDVGTREEPGDEEQDRGVDAQTEASPGGQSRVRYLNYAVLDDYGWDLSDPDLFEKAADADLDAVDFGEFVVRPGESLLEGAERRGFAWPYACRGGACANCAVRMCEGDLSQPVDHILPDAMLDRDIRLSCNGIPLADELTVVYNLKHLPDLDDLRLPPHPFRQAYPHLSE